jgi:Lar family restriction alleviation protein
MTDDTTRLADQEALSCPFCGGSAERIDIPADDGEPNAGGSLIGCTRCGASSPVHFDRKENLLNSWNERAPASKWQTIDSAPRDGRAILLYCPTFYFGGGVYVGWWGGTYFDVCTEGQTDHPYSDDGATHWMPFPSAPVAS